MPLLMVLYKPAQYGAYVVVISAAYIFANFILLRADHHILGVSSKRKKVALNSFVKVLYFCALALGACAYFLSKTTENVAFTIVSAILLTSSLFAFNNYQLALGLALNKVALIGKVKTLQAIVMVSLQYLFATWLSSINDLILANAISVAVTNFLLSYKLKVQFHRSLFVVHSRILYKKKSFYFKESLIGFLFILKNHFTVLLLAIFIAGPLYGVFALFYKLILTPVDLISRSISQVILSGISIKKMATRNQLVLSSIFLASQIIFFIPVVIYNFYIFDIVPVDWKFSPNLFALLMLLITSKLMLDSVVNSLSRDAGLNYSLLFNTLFLFAMMTTPIMISILPLGSSDADFLKYFLLSLYGLHLSFSIFIWLRLRVFLDLKFKYILYIVYLLEGAKVAFIASFI